MPAKLEVSLETERVKKSQRNPMNVRCGVCDHVWVAAYMPMDVSDLVKITKNLRCPMCAAPAKEIYLTTSP